MTNPNDLAFSTDAFHAYARGLTKREYFAVMAMQGCVGREGHFYLYPDPESDAVDVNTPERYAKVAIACADALIKELSKEPKNEA